MKVIALDKRKHKRKKLDRFLGSHLVDKKGKEFPVNVHDISENGMSLEIQPEDAPKLKSDEIWGMRIYLTQHNYLHLVAKIASVKHDSDANCIRVGVSFHAPGVTDLTMYHVMHLVEIIAHITQAQAGKVAA